MEWARIENGFVRYLLTLMMLAGCAADDCPPIPEPDAEFDALLEAAEAELGPLPAKCIEHHEVVIVSDMADYPDSCTDDYSGKVLGCVSYVTPPGTEAEPGVWILECQREPGVTLRHERLHTLMTCLGLDDPEHEYDIWDTLGVR